MEKWQLPEEKFTRLQRRAPAKARDKEDCKKWFLQTEKLSIAPKLYSKLHHISICSKEESCSTYIVFEAGGLPHACHFRCKVTIDGRTK
ncbi:hypothetical protein EUGRSUZ_K00379 [Eucalyptus grandis]|uniref:Uncharacterized protein n=2 Tax=Eucalyptus grandis TaxID=71139 RepID=A0ACC3IS78_EUCGR|nr:hypothetical protein EUGRSUZ_K00379 [Eucalyptus grandis]